MVAFSLHKWMQQKTLHWVGCIHEVVLNYFCRWSFKGRPFGSKQAHPYAHRLDPCAWVQTMTKMSGQSSTTLIASP